MKMLIVQKTYMSIKTKRHIFIETGKNSYIVNENTAGVNHFKLINEDPNGDIRFYANKQYKTFYYTIKSFCSSTLYIRGRPCRYK